MPHQINAHDTEVRPARSDDVAAIVEIERRMATHRANIGNGSIEPWDADRIREEIRNGISIVGQNGPFCMGFVIGHWHPKPATIEILRLGVDPYYRDLGIGSRIFADILHRASMMRNKNPVRQLICCVPESELNTLCPWLARRSFTESKYDARSGLVRMTSKIRQHVIHKGAAS